MAHSTCTQRDAILRVATQSFSDNCESINLGGMFNVTFLPTKRSPILNTLFAISESPSSKQSSKPLCTVRFLSDVLPQNKLDTTVIDPDGEIPINALKVLWFL